MGNNLRENLIDQYTEIVKSLAVSAIYDEDVNTAVQNAISEACFFLSKLKISNPKMTLFAFKCHLENLANMTHTNLPEYKRTLEYAASIVTLK